MAPAPVPDFDWHAEREFVAVRQLQSIAVYPNNDDDVVIRWQGDGMYVEDSWGVVRRQDLAQLISRLQAFERGDQ